VGSIELRVIASRLLDEDGSERLVGICDPEGRFRISVPATSRSLSFVAKAGGYVPVARSVDLSAMPPRRKTVLIHLSVGLVARGRVLESRGTSVSNAIIKAVRVETQNNPLGAQEIS